MRVAVGAKSVNSFAPAVQETKRRATVFLFDVLVMFHLSFNVARAATANSTHKI